MARKPNATNKTRTINKHQLHKGDTGSPEVQVALMSKRIKQLTDHLKTHQKDNSSKRGLLQIVNKRRRLLLFLKREDEKRYKKILKELKLKTV
jgi:small subunit ribosomal protein S15